MQVGTKKAFGPDSERAKKCTKVPKFGQTKNKKDRAVLPKPKLIVYIGRF